MLLGFPGHHAFTHRPTYRRLKAQCSREELAARLAEPAVRAAILAEEDLPLDPNVLFDGMFALAQYSGDRLYHLGEPPDYEPTADRTVASIARDRGQELLPTMYDLMLEANAAAMLMLPMFNYSDGNHDAIREMMTHPAGVLGLSDGGAHCSMICDASYPTFLLTHWARDRHRGDKLPLEYVVRKQSHDTAQAVRSFGPGRHRRGEEGRRQRDRHGRPDVARAADGVRPARRRSPSGAGRLGVRRDDRERSRHAAPRRRHGRPAGPIGSRRALITLP